MKTATFIKELKNFRGEARLYKLSEPLVEDKSWYDEEAVPSKYDYVVVSAVNIEYSGPETYISGADKDGNVLDWMELSGSFRGALDYVRALHNAGYGNVTK